jgi:asparagine synthase (glutamine-hydrolysing)
MCGITGFQGHFEDLLLREMAQLIVHRGPDDFGELFLPSALGVNTGLAQRRLSIIDLSPNGHQPMSINCVCCKDTSASSEKKMWLVYNGELYNYRELRANLENKGHVFRSRSDTEVLLHLYAEFGPKMLEQLNGIFAIALFDGREAGQHDGMQKGDLLLARDGLGVKPLYYSNTNQGFLFSSELKSLLACNDVAKNIDPVAIQQYLGYLWCPAPRTPLINVKKFEPGEAVIVRQGQAQKKWFFYDLPHGQTYSKATEEEMAGELSHQLEAAVERQMIADVPVGAFLSGGLDSSAIVAMMRKLLPNEKITCYTIGFEKTMGEGFVDDVPYAQQVAKHLNIDLNILRIGPGIIKHLGQIIYFMDEPQADPAPINAYLIAQAARQDGIKVLMSGAGGDDIFSGYRRHLALNMEEKVKQVPLFKTLIRQLSQLNLPGKHPVIRRINRYLENYTSDADRRIASYFLWGADKQRFSLLSSELQQQLAGVDTLEPLLASLHRVQTEKNSLNKMLYLEARHFLADHNLNYTDKATMAFGVEARVPLLDKELIDFAARIPPQYKQRGREGKAIFKKAMEGFLPKEVIYRGKTGFGAPLRYWLTHELKPLIYDILSPQALSNRGLFNPHAVQQLVKANESGKIDANYTIFSLISIELWCRMFLDKKIPAPIDIVV